MKLQLQRNGYLPFLPVVVPMTAITIGLAALIDSRPFAEAATVGLLGSVSWWAWASWRLRRRAHSS